MDKRLDMTQEDAVALVAVSLEALIHRHRVVPEEAMTYMPARLLRMALDQLEENGANTFAVRAEFMQEGFDLSAIPTDAEAGERCYSDDKQSIDAAEFNKDQEVTAGDLSRSRVPKVIAEAILVKFHEGWSKSRIAREFRLNRRTIIRICAGC